MSAVSIFRLINGSWAETTKGEDWLAGVVVANFICAWAPLSRLDWGWGHGPGPVVVEPVEQVETIKGVQPVLMRVVLRFGPLRLLAVDQVEWIATERIGGVEDARFALRHTVHMLPPGSVSIKRLQLAHVEHGSVPIEATVVVGVDLAWRIAVGVAVKWIVSVAGNSDAFRGVDRVLVDRLAVGPCRIVIRDGPEDAGWAFGVIGSDIFRTFEGPNKRLPELGLLGGRLVAANHL